MDRLEVFTSSGPPSHDLAFEAGMLESASRGCCSMLAASWTGPVVVLGYSQPTDDIDVDYCRRSSIPVLRRLSGGTGVIHHGDLGLSLALPREHPWAASIVGLYDRFLDVLEPALAELGSRAVRPENAGRATRVRSAICFFDQLADTLAVGSRKAVGCSQTRKRHGVLIHAAILLSVDAELYSHVFGVEEELIESRLGPAVEGHGWRDVAARATARFGRALELEPVTVERTQPPVEALDQYRLERWSPVPDDGI